nr:serine/threonine-protein kinase atm [Quercus suber]
MRFEAVLCLSAMIGCSLMLMKNLRKGSRFSHATVTWHEFKFLCLEAREQYSTLCWLGRLQNYFREVFETCNALFRSYEDRLSSNEWQAAMRLRKHKDCWTMQVCFGFTGEENGHLPSIPHNLSGKSLLRAVLGHANWKEPFVLNEWVMILWPHWTKLSSNFGVTLVVSSKEKLVIAREVLAAGPQPQPTLVTVILTLMHMAICSEEVDLEAVFMIYAFIAIDPYQRELVNAVLHNLSRQLIFGQTKGINSLLRGCLWCKLSCTCGGVGTYIQSLIS